MKATVDIVELREALKKAYPLKINKQLQVLSNILVEFKDGKATLSTTDLHIGVRVSIDSKAGEPFSTLLPMRTMGRFLHGANGNVIIEQGKSPKDFTLQRDMGELSLTTALPSEFPAIPQAYDLTWATLDAKWFCRMVGIVAMACAPDESRPVLTGVHCKDGAIAAADGFRLYCLKDDRLTFGLGERDVIIPYSAITKMRRLFGKEEEVEVAFEETTISSLGAQDNKEIRRVYFRAGGVSMVAEVIQGTYPKYESLIPDKYDSMVSFSAPLMAQRLGMIDERNVYGGIIRFVFQENDKTKEQECLLRAGNDDYGHYSLLMPVKIMSKEGGKIAFNMRYIVEAMKVFSLVNLELTNITSPGKFTGDVDGLTIVVMPMFCQW